MSAYLALGWCAVPVTHPSKGGPSPGKRPSLGSAAAWRRLWARPELWHPARPEVEQLHDGTGWEFLRLTPESLELLPGEARNVGANLGEPSGGLADVDLDCPEAIELAPRFLRESWTFGRASAPRSHRLYLAPGALTQKLCDLKPDGSRGGKTICELRATAPHNLGKGIGGSQTVLPGSTHASGEAVEWDPDSLDASEAPLLVDAAELTLAVRRLAAAVLVMRHAGRAAALSWLDGTGAVPFPELREAVKSLCREWWQPKGHADPLVADPGSRHQKQTRTPGSATGRSWIATVRDLGPAAVAAALGLEVVDRGGRPPGIRPCPGCAAQARGSTGDRRPPAEITSDGSAWHCFRCGARGDAAALAAIVVCGKTRGLGRGEWAAVRTECETRGILEAA